MNIIEAPSIQNFTSKSVEAEHLNSVMESRVLIRSPDEVEVSIRVYDVLLTFLSNLKKETLPPYEVLLSGSRLTDLFAMPTHCNDIDIKTILIDTNENAIHTLSKVEHILALTLSSLLQKETPSDKITDFNVKCFSPFFFPPSHTLAGYTLKGDIDCLPLEFPVHVISDLTLPSCSMNVNSLIVRLDVFNGYIGTVGAHQYQLSSSEGDCVDIITSIQKKTITAKNPEKIQRFGWFRYLMAITEGFTDPKTSINQAFYQNEAQTRSNITHELHRFIKMKRSLPSYLLFTSCNAVFHCPAEDPLLTNFIEAFFSLLKKTNPNEENPWPLFLEKSLSTSINPKDFLSTLKLLLPLFSKNILLKTHLNHVELQCEFTEGTHKFYVLIPFLTEADKEHISKLIPTLGSIEIPNAFNLHTENISKKEAKNFCPNHFVSLSIFPDLYQSNVRICQEIALAWVLRFPHLFHPLLKEVKEEGLQFLRSGPLFHYPTVRDKCCLYISEKNISQKIWKAVKAGNFPKAKAELLLGHIKNKKTALNEFSISLQGPDLSLLSKKKIKELLGKKSSLIELLSRLPIDSFTTGTSLADVIYQLNLLSLNEDKPKFACVAIKQILHTYQSELSKAPPALWQKLTLIASSVPQLEINQKPWKALLTTLVSHLSSEHTKPDVASAEFLCILSDLAGSFTPDELPLTFYLKISNLVTPKNPLMLLPILNYEATEEHVSQVQEYLPSDTYPDPLNFERTLKTLLDKNLLTKALRLLKYQEILLEHFQSENTYKQIFHKSLETYQYEEATLCLNSLYRVRTTFESFTLTAVLYYRKFPTDISSLHNILNLESNKEKSAWTAYLHLHVIPEVASYLESTHLLKEESKDYLKNEKNKDILASYQMAATSRIKHYTATGQAKLACDLSTCLPLLGLDDVVISKLLTNLAISCKGSPEKAYKIVLFIATNFNFPLDDTLFECFAHLTETSYVHRLMIALAEVDKTKISAKMAQNQFINLVSKLDTVTLDTLKDLEEQIKYYLPLVSDETRFALAQKCSTLSSSNIAIPLFTLSMNAIENLKQTLSHHTWTANSIQRYLTFLPKAYLISEEHMELILTKTPNYTHPESRPLIDKISPHFNENSEKIFALQTKDQINRALSGNITQNIRYYLDFSLDFAPIFLKDLGLYEVFLKCAERSLQAGCNQQVIQKTLKLTQTSPELKEDYDPKNHSSLENSRIKVALDCISGLTMNSPPLDLTWTIKYISNHMTNPSSEKIISKITALSIQSAALLTESIYFNETFNIESAIHWKILHIQLSSLSSAKLNPEKYAILEPTLLKIAQHMTALPDANILNLEIISLCSKELVSLILAHGHKNQSHIVSDLILHIHLTRIGRANLHDSTFNILTDLSMYLNYLETAINKYKITKIDHLPVSLLYTLFMSQKAKKSTELQELISLFLETVIRLSVSGNESSHLFSQAALALQLLLENRDNLPVDSKFQSIDIAAKLVLFAYECPWEDIQFYAFFKFHKSFTELLSFEQRKDKRFAKLLSPNFFIHTLQKAYDAVAKKSTMDHRDLDAILHLSFVAYHSCPAYNNRSPDMTPKELILNIFRFLLFKHRDITLTNILTGKILTEITNHCQLSGLFINDLTLLIAANKKISLEASYVEMLSTHLPKKSLKWETCIKLAEEIFPQVAPIPKLELLLEAYSTFLDFQFSLNKETVPAGADLNSLTRLYLSLIEKSPKLHLPFRFLNDIVSNTKRYASPGNENNYISIVLKCVSIQVKGFSNDALGIKTAHDLFALYQKAYDGFSFEETRAFAPAFIHMQNQCRNLTGSFELPKKT